MSLIKENEHSEKNKFLFGDEKMFEFIFKAYFPRLMAFAIKFVPDRVEAEDIIQEAFLKIWKEREKIEEDTFRSYVFTLVRNACLNHIKHQRIVSSYNAELEDKIKGEELYYTDFFSDPYHQTVFNEMESEIKVVLNNLSEQTRRVFHLSRFKGLKNTEIAQKLNITLRTVEKHNTKALQKLKEHFTSNYLLALVVIEMIKEL
ncbi:RNA polymerase sigma-70 factor [Mariniphaga sediminis]|uniref:RNA polymerase sigma-70 factor n=1 Tax=Mariniphaga sediminis TaxID=1628158 RepID=UPI00356A7AC1